MDKNASMVPNTQSFLKMLNHLMIASVVISVMPLHKGDCGILDDLQYSGDAVFGIIHMQMWLHTDATQNMSSVDI